VIPRGCWQVAVPRQEFINPVHGMVGDMRQHTAQSGFRVDTVQLGRADQRVNPNCAFAATVSARKQAFRSLLQSRPHRLLGEETALPLVEARDDLALPFGRFLRMRHWDHWHEQRRTTRTLEPLRDVGWHLLASGRDLRKVPWPMGISLPCSGCVRQDGRLPAESAAQRRLSKSILSQGCAFPTPIT
jgi:hypothetical protein